MLRAVVDAGLNKHEWETEWQALEPLVADSPAEALPELDDLVERMMVERGHMDEAGTAAAEAEPELVAEFREAQRIARLVEEGEPVDPGDIGAAVAAYRNLYGELLGNQPA
jgi:hypothetical protein